MLENPHSCCGTRKGNGLLSKMPWSTYVLAETNLSLSRGSSTLIKVSTFSLFTIKVDHLLTHWRSSLCAVVAPNSRWQSYGDFCFTGRGVFTSIRIPASTFVVEYHGVISQEDSNKVKRKECLDNYLFHFSCEGTNWWWVQCHVLRWSVLVLSLNFSYGNRTRYNDCFRLFDVELFPCSPDHRMMGALGDLWMTIKKIVVMENPTYACLPWQKYHQERR